VPDRVAELSGIGDRDEIALAAILHDIGRPVLARLHPGYAERFDRRDRVALADLGALGHEQPDDAGGGRGHLDADLVDLDLGEGLVGLDALAVADEPGGQDAPRRRVLLRQRGERHVGHARTTARIAASMRSGRGSTAYSSEWA